MVVCKQAKWNIRPEHIPLSVVVPFHLSMDGLYILIDDQQVLDPMNSGNSGGGPSWF